jgi:hypothetical protein
MVTKGDEIVFRLLLPLDARLVSAFPDYASSAPSLDTIAAGLSRLMFGLSATKCLVTDCVLTLAAGERDPELQLIFLKSIALKFGFEPIEMADCPTICSEDVVRQIIDLAIQRGDVKTAVSYYQLREAQCAQGGQGDEPVTPASGIRSDDRRGRPRLQQRCRAGRNAVQLGGVACCCH